MRIVAIDVGADVTGFALAGVEARHCGVGDVDSLLGSLSGPGSDVGLIIVSEAAAGTVSAAVERLRAREGAPVLLILPPPGVEMGELQE